VRGLTGSLRTIGQHLQGIKERHEHGVRDVVILQETHLNPQEHDTVWRQHAAMWGFKPQIDTPLSFWASGDRRSSGVAILIHPYGRLQGVQPWCKHLWSERLIMLKATIDGTEFVLINIYAPSNGRERREFWIHLRTTMQPLPCPVILGGDFNCVLNNAFDRVGPSSGIDDRARQLEHLVQQWGLVDGNCYQQPRTLGRRDIAEYASQHHTYSYTSEGACESSRLNRFYVSAEARKWIKMLRQS
jgi:exonuclease III